MWMELGLVLLAWYLFFLSVTKTFLGSTTERKHDAKGPADLFYFRPPSLELPFHVDFGNALSRIGKVPMFQRLCSSSSFSRFGIDYANDSLVYLSLLHWKCFLPFLFGSVPL